MIRRVDSDSVPPAALVVFDGVYATAAAWEAAFAVWHEERGRWESAHPGAMLPSQVLSECPFDWDAL